MERDGRSALALTLFVALVAVIGTSACSSGAQREPGVSGTEGNLGSWALDSFGEGEAAEPPSDPPPTLVLDESGRASGSTSGNRFTGSYTAAEPASLSFSPLATTRMACLDPSIATQETRYLEALGKAAGFSVSEGRLRLSDAQGNVLLIYRQEDAAGDTTGARE